MEHLELKAGGSQDLNNKVLSVFRYKMEYHSEVKGIGILLADGTIKQCFVNDDGIASIEEG